MTADEFKSFFESVKNRSNELLEAGERYRSEYGDIPQTLRSYSRRGLRRFIVLGASLPRSIWEEVNLRVLHRWKPQEPLIYSGVPYIEGSVGFERGFGDIASLGGFRKHFCRSLVSRFLAHMPPKKINNVAGSEEFRSWT